MARIADVAALTITVTAMVLMHVDATHADSSAMQVL